MQDRNYQTSFRQDLASIRGFSGLVGCSMCQSSQEKVACSLVSAHTRGKSHPAAAALQTHPIEVKMSLPKANFSSTQTILLSPPQPALKSAAGPGLHFEKYRANEALFSVSYINKAGSFWWEWSSLCLWLLMHCKGEIIWTSYVRLHLSRKCENQYFYPYPCRDGQTEQLRGSLTSPLGELLAHDKMAKDPGTVILHYCSGFMRNLSAHLRLFINLWIALSTCTWKRHSRSSMSLCDTGVFSGHFQTGQIPSEGRIT